MDREEAAVAAKKKHVYRFSVVTKGRELHLAAPDRQAKEQWMRVLRNSISIINIGQQRKAMMGEFDDWLMIGLMIGLMIVSVCFIVLPIILSYLKHM